MNFLIQEKKEVKSGCNSEGEQKWNVDDINAYYNDFSTDIEQQTLTRLHNISKTQWLRRRHL